MATVTKEWANGDLLTLITSAGGIAVTSAENLTGDDREMTIRVQTTNQGTKAFQDVLIKQLKYTIPQDGYWIHKDTDVDTYFGADADFITDGVMSRPDWIANAKEIKLCSGITDLELTDIGGVMVCTVFIADMVDYTNLVLETIDLSLTTIPTIYQYTFMCTVFNPSTSTYSPGNLRKIILSSSVTGIDMESIYVYAVNPNDVSIENIPPSLISIGSDFEYGGGTSPIPGMMNIKSYEGSGAAKFILKTPLSNVSALQSLITGENAAGRGIAGDYQIVGV
jgi:hypothetical protein